MTPPKVATLSRFRFDPRPIQEMTRSINRTMAQIARNMRTGPLSAERREIQRLGRTELEAAVAWFKTTHADQGAPS